MKDTDRLILRCDDCGQQLPEHSNRIRCNCGGLLAVHHQPSSRGEALRAEIDAGGLAGGSRGIPSGVWRFASIVQPLAAAGAVSHPEGNTPLVERRLVSEWCGTGHLLL